MYNWPFWSVIFVRTADIYMRPSLLKYVSWAGVIWSHFFFRFQPIPQQRGCVGVALLMGDSALFQWVLWRVWNVGGQRGPGVSNRLNILAIHSVSVRPDGCLFLPCLMFGGSDRSRSCSHGFHRRMSRLCSWIQQASRLWPFLSPGIAAAASSSRRHSCNCGFVRTWME